MLDIHNHILPGVDDGATSLDEALHMADRAVADGISEIICTPHMDTANSVSDLLLCHAKKREALQSELDARGMPLRLHGGAEWMLSEDLVAVLAALPGGRLQGSAAFLVELSPYMPAEMLSSSLFSAHLRKLIPIWAHPERHPDLGKNPQQARGVVQAGAWLQLTSGSLLGRFGKTIRQCAEQLCQLFPERIVLASDAHDAAYRFPELREAYAFLNTLSAGLGERAQENLLQLFQPARER